MFGNLSPSNFKDNLLFLDGSLDIDPRLPSVDGVFCIEALFKDVGDFIGECTGDLFPTGVLEPVGVFEPVGVLVPGDVLEPVE